MHSNTIMHQLLTLLPRHQFDQAVSGFSGDAYVKKFTMWNQLTTLLYAQASGKTSLRDIQTALGTQEPKLYHLGLPPVKRSTLADANAGRDWPRRNSLKILPIPSIHAKPSVLVARAAYGPFRIELIFNLDRLALSGSDVRRISHQQVARHALLNCHPGSGVLSVVRSQPGINLQL